MQKPTLLFLNFGHALDHLMMLIFPTVVLALSAELQRPYAELLPLSLGGFVAFGLCSLPAGWLADRFGRRPMMLAFFFGVGLSAIATGFTSSPAAIAVGLTFVGAFAAIYHPVGIAMLVREADQVGRALGQNGVWGNMGVALAALLAGALADLAGWRAAFVVPGIVALLAGIGFARWAPAPHAAARPAAKPPVQVPRDVMLRVFAVLAVTTVASGIIFNATTVTMPKLFDERLKLLAGSTLGIGALVSGVYVLAAMAQLVVGRLIDRRPLRAVLLPFAVAQVPLLLLAGSLENLPMLGCALAMMFVVFGLIPINDAMVAKYIDDEWRSRAYAIRFVVSFGASALAIPLVAHFHRATGGFQAVFSILAVVAAGTLAAALFFPRRDEAPATARAVT